MRQEKRKAPLSRRRRAGLSGGQAADYCSANALKGVKGYRLRLHDDAEANLILHEMRREFHAHALDPRRMFAETSAAGIPIGRH